MKERRKGEQEGKEECEASVVMKESKNREKRQEEGVQGGSNDEEKEGEKVLKEVQIEKRK